MNAITLLKSQHRAVEELFAKFENAKSKSAKRKIFLRIADQLTVHTTIEERHMYPAAEAAGVQPQTEEAYDEHMGVKKLVLEALENPDRPGFDGLVAAIKGAVEHHVEEEEHEMFPRLQKKLEANELKMLGEKMEAEAAEIEREGAPHEHLELGSEKPAGPNGMAQE